MAHKASGVSHRKQRCDEEGLVALGHEAQGHKVTFLISCISFGRSDTKAHGLPAHFQLVLGFPGIRVLKAVLVALIIQHRLSDLPHFMSHTLTECQGALRCT